MTPVKRNRKLFKIKNKKKQREEREGDVFFIENIIKYLREREIVMCRLFNKNFINLNFGPEFFLSIQISIFFYSSCLKFSIIIFFGLRNIFFFTRWRLQIILYRNFFLFLGLGTFFFFTRWRIQRIQNKNKKLWN